MLKYEELIDSCKELSSNGISPNFPSLFENRGWGKTSISNCIKANSSLTPSPWFVKKQWENTTDVSKISKKSVKSKLDRVIPKDDIPSKKKSAKKTTVKKSSKKTTIKN